MGSKFDAELNRIQGKGPESSNETQAPPAPQLEALQHEIMTAKAVEGASVDCHMEHDDLCVTVGNQTIGLWRAEGDDLALYRPGSDAADSHVTSTADAARMTARLVAAAHQA